MEQKTAELKPCPFCGSEAAFIGDTASIKCKCCGGAFICTNPLISRYEAAEAWNKRDTTTIIQCKYFLPPHHYQTMAAELSEQIAAGGALVLSPALEKVAEVPRSGKLQIVAEVDYGKTE